jgi:hypothetical protein
MNHALNAPLSDLRTFTEPFPHLVWSNFMSREACDELVRDVESFSTSSSRRDVMGGRAMLPNTSSTFSELIDHSPAWAAFQELLDSPAFLAQLTDHLGSTTRYLHTPVFAPRHGWLTSLINRIRSSTQHVTLSNASMKQVLGLIALRVVFTVRRWAVGISARLQNRVAYELLYDYSRARQGYVREIHRDSDARDIVFLLYLNSTAKEDGGALQLHRLNPGGTPLPRPKPQECSLLMEIEPHAGTLVAFQNTAQAYHSVQLMVGANTQRHFIYGAVTRLMGRDARLRKQSHLKTDWLAYS